MVTHQSTPRSAVIALYRTSLRESHKLSDPILRQAFTNHIRNRFKRNVRVANEDLRYRKIKTARMMLNHLQAANAGTKAAVYWALCFGYGVCGPLRQSNLKVLKDFGGPYDQYKQARPPPFHPALHALLTHQPARIKLNSKAQPNGPAWIPLALEQRGWLGKLPERRENNAWWKWWRTEPSKIQVPPEIELATEGNPRLSHEKAEHYAHSSQAGSGSFDSLQLLGLPPLKSQGAKLTRRVEQYASNRTLPNPPRRSPECTIKSTTAPDFGRPAPTTPSQNRFLRRRYRDVLSRMPLLTFRPAFDLQLSAIRPIAGDQNLGVQTRKSNAPGKYSVHISPVAANRGSPRHRATYSIMSDEDHQWIQRATEAAKLSKSKT